MKSAGTVEEARTTQPSMEIPPEASASAVKQQDTSMIKTITLRRSTRVRAPPPPAPVPVVPQVTRRKRFRFEMDVGSLPEGLQSILRKEKATVVQSMARDHRKVTIRPKYLVKVISPLPGYVSGHVRMPTDDVADEQTTVTAPIEEQKPTKGQKKRRKSLAVLPGSASTSEEVVVEEESCSSVTSSSPSIVYELEMQFTPDRQETRNISMDLPAEEEAEIPRTDDAPPPAGLSPVSGLPEKGPENTPPKKTVNRRRSMRIQDKLEREQSARALEETFTMFSTLDALSMQEDDDSSASVQKYLRSTKEAKARRKSRQSMCFGYATDDKEKQAVQVEGLLQMNNKDKEKDPEKAKRRGRRSRMGTDNDSKDAAPARRTTPNDLVARWLNHQPSYTGTYEERQGKPSVYEENAEKEDGVEKMEEGVEDTVVDATQNTIADAVKVEAEPVKKEKTRRGRKSCAFGLAEVQKEKLPEEQPVVEKTVETEAAAVPVKTGRRGRKSNAFGLLEAQRKATQNGDSTNHKTVPTTEMKGATEDKVDEMKEEVEKEVARDEVPVTEEVAAPIVNVRKGRKSCAFPLLNAQKDASTNEKKKAKRKSTTMDVFFKRATGKEETSKDRENVLEESTVKQSDPQPSSAPPLEVILDDDEKEEEAPSGKEREPEHKAKIQGKNMHSSEVDRAPFDGLGHIGMEFEEEETTECVGMCTRSRRRTLKPSNFSVSPWMSASNLKDEATSSFSRFSKELNDELDDVINSFSDVDREWYRIGESCRGNISLPWTDLLRPTTRQQWVGCEMISDTLAKILKKWAHRISRQEDELRQQEAGKRKRARRDDSDSDYEVEEVERPPNPIVLHGPVGGGKSALIRALCDEMGYSILEMHPGELRNGTSLRKKLAGALDSHRMPAAGGIASFFGAKKEEPKKQERKNLILIESPDIVFSDLDKEFWPALKSLIRDALVPVVMSCNELPPQLDDPEAQLNYHILYVERPPTARLRRLIQASVLGLTGQSVDIPSLDRLIERNEGDIRATLNDIQMMIGTDVQEDEFSSSFHRHSLPSCRLVQSQSTVWVDYREELEMKREQHRRMFQEHGEEIPLDGRLAAMEEASHSLFASAKWPRRRKEMATEVLPILAIIDGDEQKKIAENRRHQHHFDRVNLTTSQSIDPLGHLRRTVSLFRAPDISS